MRVTTLQELSRSSTITTGEISLVKSPILQHDYQNVIISTQHIHLDHDNCLEIVAVRGQPREVTKLADMLKSIKGVKHCTLSMSSTGEHIE